MKSQLLIAALVVAFLFLLPVIIPVVIVMTVGDRLRLRAATKRLTCPQCGGRLGPEALALGDAAWVAYRQEVWRRSPRGARSRLIRIVDAVCPTCGATLRLDLRLRQFSVCRNPLPLEPVAEHSR
jgi:predicted RNA-binding Zn-ribbon protein involved in translation (DUF1610 family)